MNPHRIEIGMALATAFLCGTLLAPTAVAKTWSGLGNGSDWHDGNNWDPVGVPSGVDSVTVAAGAVIVLSNETAAITAFTMTGGTLTFTNWMTRLRAETVDLQGGTLTLPAAFANNQMSNRVWIVCGDFTLGETAAINVDGKGYVAANGPGGASTGIRRSGGGHGGRGGLGDVADQGNGGPVNGVVHTPENPGSGGCSTGEGGAGGGAVRIQATGTVDIRGTISVRGANNSVWRGGGGSGGSIWISCAAFAAGNNALLAASGGNGLSHGGGGGGGRIALAYQTLAGTPGVRFSTAPGVGWADSTANIASYGWAVGSGWGTLSLTDAGLIGSTLDNNRFQQVNLYFKDLSALALDALTVQNCSVVFATPGLALSVADNLTVSTGGHFGIGEYGGDSNSVLTVGNNLSVTGGGLFSVFSGPAVAALDDFGARIEVTNTLSVAASSWIHPHAHPVAGGAPQFRAATVTVSSGGGFNAHARGYGAKQGPEHGRDQLARGSGGGHGGRGGSSDGTFFAGGREAGSLVRPVRPGSGGGVQAFGGGLIAIKAPTVVLDGTLSANGAKGWSSGQLGGGAGGGILIDTVNLSGQSPLLQANGGEGATSLGGGGGGGRIALHYESVAGLVSPRFRTSPGFGMADGNEAASWWHTAGEGTLWCSTPNLLGATIDGERYRDVRFHADGFSSWTVADLTVSNSAITFGGEGFELNVTGHLTIGPNGMLGLGTFAGATQPVMQVGGNLTVRGGGRLQVYGARTNGTDVALGAVVDIAGNLAVETGGWVIPYSHPADGGSPRFRAQSLDVAANGGFKAIGRGYPTQSGLGAGTDAGSGRGGGGGHGGWGADGSSTARGGITNGWELAPVQGGSGGGQLNYYDPPTGGSGGGVIWLELGDTARIAGLLNADGAESRDNGGGGSGGGILVGARKFDVTSAALLKANGGKGHLSHGGGGGGGRIALWREVSAAQRDLLLARATAPGLIVTSDPFSGFAGTPQVDFGVGYVGGAQLATQGTVRFVDGRPRATLIMIR